RQFDPAVVHAHFGTATAAFAATVCGRRPFIVTYRGSDLNPVPSARLPRAAMGRLLSQLAALRADRIVCVSGGLRNRLWWRRRRVAILASGVDEVQFRPQPRNAARRTLGWAQDERVVLFHAGHNPRNKRLDLARKAVELASESSPRLRLEIMDGSI